MDRSTPLNIGDRVKVVTYSGENGNLTSGANWLGRTGTVVKKVRHNETHINPQISPYVWVRFDDGSSKDIWKDELELNNDADVEEDDSEDVEEAIRSILLGSKTIVPRFEPGHGRPDLDMLHQVINMIDQGTPQSEIRETVAGYIVTRKDDRVDSQGG